MKELAINVLTIDQGRIKALLYTDQTCKVQSQ